jgi:hypothetical protein
VSGIGSPYSDWLRYTFRLSLPSSLPRHGITPSGRLMYWLVGRIDGFHATRVLPPETGVRRSTSPRGILGSRSFSSDDRSGQMNPEDYVELPLAPDRGADPARLPMYSAESSALASISHLGESIQSERRIAISHNPNPEGGVNRLDDDFTLDLPGFGTCRTQVRVNEVRACRRHALTLIVVCSMLLPNTLVMYRSFSFGYPFRRPGSHRFNDYNHPTIYWQTIHDERVVCYSRAWEDSSFGVQSPLFPLRRPMARNVSWRR